MLLCRGPDTAYGPHPIRRILEKLALAVEIDLTWSRGFVSIELGTLPNPLSCKTLLMYPICISKAQSPVRIRRVSIVALVETGPAALYCPPG
ncbi:hypothetical protein Tco_1105536 [Tanacetum coccineum]